MSKAGAKPKMLDQKMFEEMCRINCTKAEIAQVFNVDPKTIEAWCLRTYDCDFSTIYMKSSGGGKLSVRRKQLSVALEGNVTMLIWLGKQWLGQRDTPVESDDEIKIPAAVYSIATKEQIG